MDVERLLRRVVNLLAVAVLATTAAVAGVVAAKGDPGPESRLPTVRQGLVGEVTVATAGTSDAVRLVADDVPTSRPKAEARPAVRRKARPAVERTGRLAVARGAPPAAQPEPAGVEVEHGRAEVEHEHEDEDLSDEDDDGGGEDEDGGDEGWEGDEDSGESDD
jgi:hypothetical protein